MSAALQNQIVRNLGATSTANLPSQVDKQNLKVF